MNINNYINKEIDKRVSKKRQEDIKYYIRIGLTLLIISAVTATLLAFVNAMTKEKITDNEIKVVMQQALDGIFTQGDELKSTELLGEYDESVDAVYKVYKDGETIGLCVKANPVGFKDVIGVIVGIDTEGNCVGVQVTSISDTPGVGTKVQEESFLAGFKGVAGSEIDSVELISGATISSTAVRKGVASAMEVAKDLDLYLNGSGKADETKENVNNEISEKSEETNDVIEAVPGDTPENAEDSTNIITEAETTADGGVGV